MHFLATNDLDDDIKSTKYPEGALLLSVVAVSYFPSIYSISYLTVLRQCERALTQYSGTGEIVLSARKRDNHFSEEMWSDPAGRYQVAIQNLSAKCWDLIIDGAWKISQERRASRVMSKCVDTKMPNADERELLVELEGDEVVEDDAIVWDGCELYYHRS